MSITLHDPENILLVLDSLEKQNPILYQGITFSARQYFFVDPMIPYENGKAGLGNKLAFELFIRKNKPGYYVSMDANDFKIINRFSHIVGDEVIKSIGRALRNATLQMTYTKLFRSGGDEFLLYCEKKENANLFVEIALKELDQLDLIRGTHKITLSFGIGNSYEDAEKALLEAKNKKTQINTHIIHSNID